MIIVCPECSTKFTINSDRIPDGGAKMRCARCKHVFLVEKPSEYVSPILEVMEAAQEESTMDSIGQQESLSQPPATDENLSDTPSEESDFDYDKFQELDSSTTEEGTFTFGAKTESTGDFTFTESANNPASNNEKNFVSDNDDEKISAPTNDDEVTSETPSETVTPTEPEVTTQTIPEKKGGAFSSLIRILLLLILGILIIGGVYVYINGTDQLDQTIQQIIGQQIDRPVQTGQITLSALKGEFVQNEQDGEFFLIRGEAINNYSESRAAIQVKGVIFDQNGKPLLQKTVFCGNPIDDEKLHSLSFLELEKIMGNQFGNELSNMKISSNQSIRFAIVFKDLPKNLSEFSVKVTSSKPATE